MFKKRGQNLPLGAIIILILGVAVFVFLIWGFSTGWSNAWAKINPFISSSNLDAIKESCILACSSGSKYDFCEEQRTVKFGKKIEVTEKSGQTEIEVKSVKASCYDLINNEAIADYAGIDTEVSLIGSPIVIESCSSISCIS